MLREMARCPESIHEWRTKGLVLLDYLDVKSNQAGLDHTTVESASALWRIYQTLHKITSNPRPLHPLSQANLQLFSLIYTDLVDLYW